MYDIILYVIILAGIYFLYKQISSLNELLEDIIDILKKNVPSINNN